MDNLGFQADVDLESMSTEQLLQRDNFEAIKDKAYSIIDSKDLDAALDYARRLEEKLSIFHPVSEQDSYFYYILRYWALRLRLCAITSMRPQERVQLFKKNILEIIQNDLNIKQTLFGYINFFGSSDTITEETKTFMQAMGANQEVLGENQKAFETSGFLPTVANWLKEYQGMARIQSIGAKMDGGAFRILKFFDSNPNIKLLSEDEKDNLKSLLGLYNWLAAPIVQQPKVPAGPKYIQSQRFQLPPEVLNNQPQDLTPPAAALAKPLPPVVSPPALKKLDISQILEHGQDDRPKAAPLINKPVPQNFSSTSTARPASDILPSAGLPQEPKTNPVSQAAKSALPPLGSGRNLDQIRQEIEEKKRLAQEEIEKKLDQLRNKSGRKNT